MRERRKKKRERKLLKTGDSNGQQMKDRQRKKGGWRLRVSKREQKLHFEQRLGERQLRKRECERMVKAEGERKDNRGRGV